MARRLHVRVDKIGDLVLTLPVTHRLDSQDTNEWLVSQIAAPVLAMVAGLGRFHAVPLLFAWSPFFDLIRWARQQPRWDAIVVYYAPLWVTLALWLSFRGPLLGRHSQWWSFLIYRVGVRQKRSLSEKHETEYNQQLLESLLQLEPRALVPPLKLAVTAPFEDKFKTWQLLPYHYFVVHPGMAGSAENWPLERYQNLIEILSTQTRVVITGTAADNHILDVLRDSLIRNPQVVFADGKLSLSELTSLLKYAKAVIVPSTGVAHLAASTGVRVIALYPDRVEQNATRWGPRGENVQVLSPLKGVSVEQIWNSLK